MMDSAASASKSRSVIWSCAACTWDVSGNFILGIVCGPRCIKGAVMSGVTDFTCSVCNEN